MVFSCKSIANIMLNVDAYIPSQCAGLVHLVQPTANEITQESGVITYSVPC